MKLRSQSNWEGKGDFLAQMQECLDKLRVSNENSFFGVKFVGPRQLLGH